MQSLLTLEVIRSEHPGDKPPHTWESEPPPLPPPRRRRVRERTARSLATLASRLDSEGARRAIAR
jgi:hypothetical protein